MGQPEAGGHAAPAQRARVRGQLRDRPPDSLQLPRADQREVGGPGPQTDQLLKPLVQQVDEAAPVLGRGHARVLGHEVDTLEIR